MTLTGLTPAQRAIAERVLAIWHLKEFKLKSIRPGCIPLIVAMNGCGKTHTVRALSSPKRPLLTLTIGNWSITGERAEPYVEEVIKNFIENNDAGILSMTRLIEWEAVASTPVT